MCELCLYFRSNYKHIYIYIYSEEFVFARIYLYSYSYETFFVNTYVLIVVITIAPIPGKNQVYQNRAAALVRLKHKYSARNRSQNLIQLPQRYGNF